MTNEEKINSLYHQLDTYFQFRKNLIIHEILFYNLRALEVPDIIVILMAECAYNANTSKLLISGGSPDGFYAKVKQSYKIDPDLDAKLIILIKSLESALKRNIIEFITDDKIKDYIDEIKNQDKTDKVDDKDSIVSTN